MNKKILILLPALALILGGCFTKKSDDSSGTEPSSQTETVAVESVSISQTSATLDPGEKLTLRASVAPGNASNKKIVWSSDNANAATVSSGGVVTAVAQGTARIKAAADADATKFAECVVTVNKAQIIVAETSPDTAKTYKFGCFQTNLDSYYYFKGSVDANTRGETTTAWGEGVDVKLEEAAGQYKVKILGSNKYFEMTDDHHFRVADEATILWDWNDTAKTVSRTISATTYFPGTYNQYDTISGCDISMLAGDFVFQFLYKVDPVDPTSIDIAEAAADVNAGGSVQLHASLGPVGAVGTIEWSAEGNDKVHVSEEGLVTADADAVVNSTATITASCGTLSDTCTVTVKSGLNYGTLENPLTVDQAIALLDIEHPTQSTMYVTGIVTSNDAVNSTYHNWGDYIYLANDAGTVEKAFNAYRPKAKNGSTYESDYAAANSLVGKRVIFSGTGTIYSTKYQVNSGGILESVTDGGVVPTAINLDTNDFELEQGASKTIKASFAPYGATGAISWSVDPESAGVSVNNGVVSATDSAPEGDYTVRAELTSNPLVYKEVTCTVVAGGGGGGGSSYTLDFTAKTANHSSYSDEWTYGDATLAGAANNNGGWAFVKFGPKSATISGAGYLGTYAKLNTALDFAVSTVTINLVGKCYNQDSEKANVHIEAYSDSAFTSKVAETTSQYVPAITTNEGTDTMTFTFAAPAANRYYKVVFDITNTTTYNGVAAVASIVFAE